MWCQANNFLNTGRPDQCLFSLYCHGNQGSRRIFHRNSWFVLSLGILKGVPLLPNRCRLGDLPLYVQMIHFEALLMCAVNPWIPYDLPFLHLIPLATLFAEDFWSLPFHSATWGRVQGRETIYRKTDNHDLCTWRAGIKVFNELTNICCRGEKPLCKYYLHIKKQTILRNITLVNYQSHGVLNI